MHFTTSALVVAGAALAAAQSTATAATGTSTSSAAAATHTVTVGAKSNTFEPANLTAEVGDSVVFNFVSSTAHSVLLGEYVRPCEARDAGALYSGELSSNTDNDQFIIQINTTNPLWYFCATARHCQDGMVGVINAPQVTVGGYTLEGWVELSKNTTATNTTFVTAAQGGSFKSSGKKGGSAGGDDTNATATGEAAAETSAGAAAGLVVKGGVAAGLGAFVAALML